MDSGVKNTVGEEVWMSMPPFKSGVVVGRGPHGEIWHNVPHLAVEHSPAGYNIGYGGSGPADLALNIIEGVLRNEGFDGPKVSNYNGTSSYFKAAWNLHQQFKAEFVAKASDILMLPYASILAWVNEHLAKAEEGGEKV